MRWSWDRLFPTVGFPMLVRHLYIEACPWGPSQYKDVLPIKGSPCLRSEGLATVLSLTWKSPYLGKTVFILRRGPGGELSYHLVTRSPGYASPSTLSVFPGATEVRTLCTGDTAVLQTYHSWIKLQKLDLRLALFVFSFIHPETNVL